MFKSQLAYGFIGDFPGFSATPFAAHKQDLPPEVDLVEGYFDTGGNAAYKWRKNKLKFAQPFVKYCHEMNGKAGKGRIPMRARTPKLASGSFNRVPPRAVFQDMTKFAYTQKKL
jgi:hypothetical protein